MAKIALIAMSAKPYHAGHDGLIRLAAQECDEVKLFVSTSDRPPVSGEVMAQVWRDHIEATLPDNVQVTYGGSPVGHIWKVLGAANLAGSTDDFVVYSDPEDLTTNFPKTRLEKYSRNLLDGGKITLRAVERSSTTDISGTEMRQFLVQGNRGFFIRNLPQTLDGEAVWQTLRASLGTMPSKQARTKKSQAEAAKLLGEFIAEAALTRSRRPRR